MNKIIAVCMLALFTGLLVFGQEGNAQNGEKLFKANCAACHALDKKLTGPALKGIVTTLSAEGADKEWVHKWIMNNEALRKSGDKRANKIFEEYNRTAMDVFEGRLSDKDIDDILAYTENPPAPEEPKEQQAVTATQDDSSNSIYIFVSFASIGIILLFTLYKVNQLVRLKTKGIVLNELQATRIKSLSQFYNKYKGFSYFLITLLLALSLYGVWAWLMGIGVDKGYEPEQPIYFSHRIHAGENKIDCQLCHSGAKYGKVSEIPSLSVCMNCHRNISEYTGKYIEPGKSKEFYTSEIKKIYQHIGWDEDKQAYTGKQIPVKWERIHNMPDFVYFNHSQHVVAGEKTIIADYNKKHPNQPIDVVCKACHGAIDTMNVVKMANDFTMGWCLDCHRTTEVDMNNGYNAAYFNKLHEKLKKEYGEDKSKITVDAIGGLECGKCHY
ncbi:c-type cytochrome [Apibacter adventoris]|uniref:c-type cytochrome n=1 Tax=Apibacter adventoris TaxID=1679466 RepID=UPI000CF70FDE|nr:c-type cytochrome [Apibacter adventoris]PQL92496.1 quinol:cytochrome C oxidoreductase [Apibacter adventoris]